MKIYNLYGMQFVREQDIIDLLGQEVFYKKFRGATLSEYRGEWYLPLADIKSVISTGFIED